MLAALNNQRPDRLPCQVHGWMSYYLKYFLSDMDWYQANERFSLDHAIYVSPRYIYGEKDLARWQVDRRELGQDADGNWRWDETITTPKGVLHHTGARNEITNWQLEYLIKTERDFDIWNAFSPFPQASTSPKSRKPETKSATGASSDPTPSAPARAVPGKACAPKSARRKPS